jgi:hypothetical protein
MRSFVTLLSITGIAVLAACGGSQQPIDQSLQSDLSLASQMRPYGQPYMSPMEMGYGGQPGYPQPYGYSPYGYQPQYYPQPAPQQVVYRSAPVIQRVPSGGGGGGSVARAPRTNTKQDAILGATAGAIIGATTSRDRLKGAVIGAAAGGLLGGIIGSTIHVQR